MRLDSILPRRSSGWCLAAVAALTAGVASAELRYLDATDDPSQPSSFTLDFGGGYSSTAAITSTNYVLAIDQAAGTAQFVRYRQQVQPLDLFGFSTGDITVTIVPGSSSGTCGQ